MTSPHTTSSTPTLSPTSSPPPPPSLSLTTVSYTPSPPPHLAKLAFSTQQQQPLGARRPAAAGLSLQVVTTFSAANVEARPLPWAARDAQATAKGAVGPTRANLPRRRVARKGVSVPLPAPTPAPVADDAKSEPAQETEVPQAQVEQGEEKEPARRCTLQPARANLPRRRIRKAFADPNTPVRARSPAALLPPVSVPHVSEEARRCVQRLAEGVYVAFLDDPSDGVADSEQGSGRWDARVDIVPGPAAETDGAHEEGARLVLAVDASSNAINAPRKPLIPAQLTRAALFLRASLPSSSSRALVSCPALRPADAVAVAVTYLASLPGAADVEEIVYGLEEDEGVMGFWKGVLVEEEGVCAIREAVEGVRM